MNRSQNLFRDPLVGKKLGKYPTRALELASPLSLPSTGQLCVADPLTAKRAAKKDAENRKRAREETKGRIMQGLDYISNSRCGLQLQGSSNRHVDEQLSAVCKDLNAFLDNNTGHMIGDVYVPGRNEPLPGGGYVGAGGNSINTGGGDVQSPRSKANDWTPACAHLSTTSPTLSPKLKQSSSPRQDALTRALEVMRMKPDDPAAVAQSCEVLWFLAEEKEKCEQILAAGGPEAIVKSMVLHPKSLRIQECACDAIRRLAATGGSDAQRGIVVAGGIDVIAAMMIEHESKKGMQEAGCGALERIIDSMPEIRAHFVKARGVDAVISAMLKHPGTMKVQWAAVDALAALISDEQEDDEEILTQVINASGIEALVAAWQRHPTDLQLVVAINGMLHRLNSLSKEAALRVHITLRKNRVRGEQLNAFTSQTSEVDELDMASAY